MQTHHFPSVSSSDIWHRVADMLTCAFQFDDVMNTIGADPSNVTYLQDPSTSATSKQGGRGLGFCTSGADGSQGTVLDISFTDGKEHVITLYV